MERVRIGVIGVGGMGSGHCASLASIDEAELAAVCDTNSQALDEARSRFDVPAFAEHESLLDSGLVDAVIIATPHYFHPPIAEAAFVRKLHVLSEKPIAVTVGAGDRMIEAAKASGCAFGVMFQMRALGRVQAALKVVREGRLGEIYRTSLVMGWYRSQAYYDSGGWRATWAGEGGGVLINQAPHFLDVYTLLAGLPVRVQGQTRTRLHDIEVEDEAFATLEYANGAHGYLYASTTEAPGHEMFELCGDRGKLVMHGGSLRLFELRTSIRAHSVESRDMWAGPEVEEVPLEIPEGGGQHSDITRNFCRHILHGEPLIAPGEEGLHAVELFNAVILSSFSKQSVSLPVDRMAYEDLMDELQRGSRGKARVVKQRVTDQHYAGR